MFSMITNIYNKKTKEPTLMEFFTATGKLKNVLFFFLQLEMFDVCTTGDSAHIDTIFKLLPYTLTRAVSPVVHTSNISSLSKRDFFSSPVAVNNSIKVDPLIFLL